MEELKIFTNTDNEDFEGMYSGTKISVKAGESKPFTEKIAKHLAGQLAYKMALRGQDGKNILDQNVMDRLALSMISQLSLPEESVVEEESVVPTVEEKPFKGLKSKKKK